MKKFFHVTLSAVIMIGLLVGPSLSKSSRDTKSAWLGIEIQSVDEELSKAFDLPVKYGVIVNEIVEDSPADKADLKEDDIIIAFDGSKITDLDDLMEMIEDSRPGDEVTVIIIRDGDELELPVILKKKPKDKLVWYSKKPKGKNYSFSFSFDDHSYIGVSLMDLNRQLGEFFGVEKGKGALITEVHEDSPAEEIGLKAGDVIVAVDDDKVVDAEDVKEAIVDKDPGEKVDVKVLRKGKEITFSVEIGENEDDPYLYSYKHFPDHDISDIFFMPKLKSLLDKPFPVPDIDLDFEFEDFEDEFNEELEKLKKELKSLQKEMKELHEKLQ